MLGGRGGGVGGCPCVNICTLLCVYIRIYGIYSMSEFVFLSYIVLYIRAKAIISGSCNSSFIVVSMLYMTYMLYKTNCNYAIGIVFHKLSAIPIQINK